MREKLYYDFTDEEKARLSLELCRIERRRQLISLTVSILALLAAVTALIVQG